MLTVAQVVQNGDITSGVPYVDGLSGANSISLGGGEGGKTSMYLNPQP